jgi:hypothetical protein
MTQKDLENEIRIVREENNSYLKLGLETLKTRMLRRNRKLYFEGTERQQNSNSNHIKIYLEEVEKHLMLFGTFVKIMFLSKNFTFRYKYVYIYFRSKIWSS